LRVDFLIYFKKMLHLRPSNLKYQRVNYILNMETTTDTSNSVPERKGSKGKKILVIIIVLLLLGINGVLVWMLMNKQQVIVQKDQIIKTETSLKDSLTLEKNELAKNFEEMKGQNASLNEKLTEKDKEIEEQKEKIQKLINSGDAAQLAQARNEIRKFKLLLQNYSSQKDSLIQIASGLRKEKQILTENLDQEKVKGEKLVSENTKLAEKVSEGSVLRADNVKAMAVKFKSSGKEIETNKAKAAQKIKTCFTLLENHVAEKGQTDIFIRVLGPNGAAFSSTAETFKYKGQETLFSLKQPVNYDNKKQEVCAYWQNAIAFEKGQYTVEIYNSGDQVGKGDLTLK
jgi:hypothetical protein